MGKRGKSNSERTPVLRKPKSRQELENFHPIERVLWRIFEFMSSIKLAVILMVWLMIECAIGTRVESTVNAAAAKYFVYGNPRFYVLLSLLALNVLFAALIRYPWKKYQTGFLVTHTGLLTILAGSMVTSISYIDSLLVVGKDEINDMMINPDRDVLTFSMEAPRTKDEPSRVSRQSLGVQFGPLSWGSEILGVIPWGKGHEETYSLEELEPGAKVKVKRFVGHCDWEETYVPSSPGVPAIRATMSAHQAGFSQDVWLAAKPTEFGYIGAEQVSVGGMPVAMRIWQVHSQAELDHFIHAAPKGPVEETIGLLGYSVDGQHHLISLDELQKKPFEIPEKGIKLELVEYQPNLKLGEARKEEGEPERPSNPAVRLRITENGKSHELAALANHPELGRFISQSAGLEQRHFATFFRPDQKSEIQFVLTRGEQIGYRAFTSSQGCAVSTLAELDKSYPCFGVFECIPRQAVDRGRPDLALVPKPIPPGQQTFPGIEVEVSLADGSKSTAHLVRGVGTARLMVGDRLLGISYDVEREELPFAIRLDEFNEPKQPGTMSAARYESFVTVFEKEQAPSGQSAREGEIVRNSNGKTYAYRDVGKAEIKMNNPLFFKAKDGREYTLYQSGIDWSTGAPVSTYTVANDPGLIIKYVGAVVLCLGIFLMFYMGGYFKRRSPAKPERSEKPETAGERAPQEAVALPT